MTTTINVEAVRTTEMTHSRLDFKLTRVDLTCMLDAFIVFDNDNEDDMEDMIALQKLFGLTVANNAIYGCTYSVKQMPGVMNRVRVDIWIQFDHCWMVQILECLDIWS